MPQRQNSSKTKSENQNKKCHTARTVLKPNLKIVETETKSITLASIYTIVHCELELGIDTPLQVAEFNSLYGLTSPLLEK
jgi:hypothetical protein